MELVVMKNVLKYLRWCTIVRILPRCRLWLTNWRYREVRTKRAYCSHNKAVSDGSKCDLISSAKFITFLVSLVVFSINVGNISCDSYNVFGETWTAQIDDLISSGYKLTMRSYTKCSFSVAIHKYLNFWVKNSEGQYIYQEPKEN